MAIENLRRVHKLTTSDIRPGEIDTQPPVIEEFDPEDLLVDESYQRNVSQKSYALIRKIISGWDWRAFKPPVVMRTENGLCVIDGQHTAIAAASHPLIGKIPCLVISTGDVKAQAQSFVKHNRDRTAITALQMHNAMRAAGDEEALTVQQVCDNAGASIPKTNASCGQYSIGEVTSLETIRQILNKRHARATRIIIEVCVTAKLAPIRANHLKAVEMLLHGAEYVDQVKPEALAVTLREQAPELERKAKLFAAEHKVPLWRAMVTVLYRAHPKGRKNAATAA